MNEASLCLLLGYITWVVHSHIALEEKLEKVNNDNGVRFPEILPPISIMDLKRSFRRVSREDAERSKLPKKKVISRKKPWTPPPNCVPLKSSCKPPAPPCCEPCAFCQCHLFKTVCIYKMGYSYC